MSGWMILVGVLFLLSVLLGNFACAAVPGSSRAVRAVENLGYDNVRVESRGPAWGVLGGCHENDVTKFTLVGRSASGAIRRVEVCAPLVGGYTVRS